MKATIQNSELTAFLKVVSARVPAVNLQPIEQLIEGVDFSGTDLKANVKAAGNVPALSLDVQILADSAPGK